MKDIHWLEEELRTGQRLSMQGSYERRAPAKKARPHLIAARKGLREYLAKNSRSAIGWHLLSEVEECLLNYAGAFVALSRAKEQGASWSKKNMKKLILLKEYENKWAKLSLNPDQLNLLGTTLESELSVKPCDHSHSRTLAWLKEVGVKNQAAIVKELQNHGGFCDCEVLSNVVNS